MTCTNKLDNKSTEGLIYRRYNVSRINTFSVRLEESLRGIPHSTTREHSNGELDFQGLGRYIVMPRSQKSFLESLKKEKVSVFQFTSDVSEDGAYVCYSGKKLFNPRVFDRNSWHYISTDWEWTRMLESGDIVGGRQ